VNNESKIDEFNRKLVHRLVDEFRIEPEVCDRASAQNERIARTLPYGDGNPHIVDVLAPDQSRPELAIDTVFWHSNSVPMEVLGEALHQTTGGVTIPGTLADAQRVDLALLQSFDWNAAARLSILPLRLKNRVLSVARPPLAVHNDELQSVVHTLGDQFNSVEVVRSFIVPTPDYVDHMRQARRFNALVRCALDETDKSKSVAGAASLLDADQMVIGTNALAHRLLGLLVYAIRSGNREVCGRLISGLHSVALYLTPPSVALVLLNQLISDKLNNAPLGRDWLPPQRLLDELEEFYSQMAGKIGRQNPINAGALSSLIRSYDVCDVFIYGNSSSCWRALDEIHPEETTVRLVHIWNEDERVARLQSEGAYAAAVRHKFRHPSAEIESMNWSSLEQKWEVFESARMNTRGRFGRLLVVGAASYRADGAFCEHGTFNVIERFRRLDKTARSVWVVAGRYKEIRRQGMEVRELAGGFHEFVELRNFDGFLRG
jgi:hypothetical protein